MPSQPPSWDTRPNPAKANHLYFLHPEGKVTFIYPDETLDVEFLDEAAREPETVGAPTPI